MRTLALMALMVCLACMLSCGGKKVRPLEEEEAEAAARRRAEEQARLELERQAQKEPIQPLQPVEEQERGLKAIYFDYDKYNLTQSATTTLARNAQILMDDPSLVILIEGHCDERGTDEYNLALGEKRALAARDFLLNFGIAKSRISVISYGEERPLDPGHSEEAWAKNRRAEFVTK
jgi:peptidoglycan-associated lipoprotein